MKYVIFSIFSIILLFINFLFIGENYSFITPFFILPIRYYKLISILIFLFVEISIFLVYKNNFFDKRLSIILSINYLFFILYNYFSFYLVNTFLMLSIKILQFISSLYLNEDICSKNKISANLLVPYILWTFYLTLISISIFFLNNN